MRFVGQIYRKNNDIVIVPPHNIEISNGKYVIEINDIKNKRSLNQNNYLWKLINEISKKESGNYSESENIYLMLLRMCGTSYTDLKIKQEALDDFKKVYKDIQILDIEDGFATIRAYKGSSSMNTNEFSNLIETTIKYAQEVGIDTRFYLEVFNGGA